MVNGSWETLGVSIYMTIKGIKALVVTFGAILTIVTVIVMFITTILKIKGFKRLKGKK